MSAPEGLGPLLPAPGSAGPEQPEEGIISSPAPEAPASADFYAGAYARMNWAMLITGAAAAPLLLWQFGLRFAAGFLLGAAVAFLNLFWLRHLVVRVADAVTRRPQAVTRGGRMAALFLLRYALIGLGAYAIFLDSLPMLYGFFAGLILPVAGVFCEAFFEIAFALRERK